MEKISNVLVSGIKVFFKENGKQKAVLGLSGGIDSAVVLGLLVKALGNKNVTAILMPNLSITRDSSTKDAEALAKQLGVKYFIVPISSFLGNFKGLPWVQSDIAIANLNARVRAVVLYNYANSTDCLVAGTGNKSEFYMGYFTKYGDAAADFFPVGELLKTQVRQVALELGIPKVFLEKKPSAELWEGQEDEKELGITYAELDELLPLVLEGAKIPSEKKSAAELIRKRIAATEHKRRAPKTIHSSAT